MNSIDKDPTLERIHYEPQGHNRPWWYGRRMAVDVRKRRLTFLHIGGLLLMFALLGAYMVYP